MKLLILFVLLMIAAIGHANPLGIVPLSNELSVYRNVDDYLGARGFTTQLVSFNMIHEYRIGFVLDLNFYDSSRDNYWELGIVVPIRNRLSFSYQRVNGTFVNPLNQIGFTLRF